MKVITLTQPWASLVAIGAKHYETRGWSTKHRGILAIHAAKGWTADDRELCSEEPFVSALCDAGLTTLGHLDRLRGHILCVVDLVDCVSTGPSGWYEVEHFARFHQVPVSPAPHEKDFGNYGPNRFAWIMRDVRPLATPVPARGALGLWNFDPLEVTA